MNIMTVVGARPEFIQAAPVCKAIRQSGYTEMLVHTGQHYDYNMSDVFFAELDVPQPNYNLGVGSGSHGLQTGQMLIRLEELMQQAQPDYVLVYGDTNSTVAAAMAAAKLHIPVAHIEAGLRSYDRRMPEEINRVMTDHLSSILFAPTSIAVSNLKREGITSGVHHVGDVRVDLLAGLVARARAVWSAFINDLPPTFALATIHRASNTDDQLRLAAIVQAFNRLEIPVVLPVHPRLKKMLEVHHLAFDANVRVIEPVGFLAMIALLDACALVITDSGGLQKEAYMLRRPTITLRDTTEWMETVEAGWNRLCEPLDLREVLYVVRKDIPEEHPDYYGAPGVSERICDVLAESLIQVGKVVQ